MMMIANWALFRLRILLSVRKIVRLCSYEHMDSSAQKICDAIKEVAEAKEKRARYWSRPLLGSTLADVYAYAAYRVLKIIIIVLVFVDFSMFRSLARHAGEIRELEKACAGL